MSARERLDTRGLPANFAVDEETLALAARDFGGLISARPLAVVQAKSTSDVLSAIHFANVAGLKIAPRGQGHSTRGQSQVGGGIVIDMREVRTIRVEGQTAVVGAGARWDDVLRVTLDCGLTPAVLTDCPGLTVGGTLSVGGIGGQSFRFGMQTDQVEALTVVTGGGELVECSLTPARDLFDMCRGGLGQCATIVEARLRLVAAPQLARTFRLTYPGLTAWLRDQQRLAEDGRFDCLLGFVARRDWGWTFIIEATKYLATDAGLDDGGLLAGLDFMPGGVDATTTRYADHTNRLHEADENLRESGAWDAFHPWMDLFIGASYAPQLIEATLAELEPRHFQAGVVVTYPLVRAVCSTPLLQLTNERFGFLLDVLPTVDRDAEGDLAPLEETFRKIFDRARARGARVYPIGYPVGTDVMGQDDWQYQFGTEWARFATAKRAFDPNGVLTPAPRIFAA